ncbi:MAG: ammonium transporter [Pirellulaceae bacterium]
MTYGTRSPHLIVWLCLFLSLICVTGISGALAEEGASAAVEDSPTATEVADASATSSEASATEEAPAYATQADVDVLWTCLAAFLVFFMQAGFAMVEAGFTRAKNACNIMMKNLMDFCSGTIAFWLVGFGLMFGATNGLFGTTGFLFDADAPDAIVGGSFGWAFLIFQTVFAATAATIVSGAMAERTKFVGYLIYSIAITVIVYPVFGSWCWNGLVGSGGWLEGPDGGWLVKTFGEGAAFHDFAGSTVVHSIGGWAALAGAIVIGARHGKFRDGKAQPIPGHSIPLAALGVFILWLGWFGFNPGSTTAVGGGDFAKIAVTTNISAAAGAIVAMIVSWFIFKKPDTSFALNGALAGLVAITAGCDVMSAPMSALTGAVGGALVVFSVLFFDKIRVDDPVGAVSVHGVCGAWGTLAVGLFGYTNFAVQLVGVLAAFAWSFPVSMAIFLLIKYTVGLRVTAEEEATGLDISEHGMHAYPGALVGESMVTASSSMKKELASAV